MEKHIITFLFLIALGVILILLQNCEAFYSHEYVDSLNVSYVGKIDSLNYLIKQRDSTCTELFKDNLSDKLSKKDSIIEAIRYMYDTTESQYGYYKMKYNKALKQRDNSSKLYFVTFYEMFWLLKNGLNVEKKDSIMSLYNQKFWDSLVVNLY